MTGGFCTDCGARVESFEGLKGCPSCGTSNIPCLGDEQVNVSVNWHELHVLCVWAENWQRQNQLGRTVYAIAKRLHDQHPDRGPLTLAGELGEIAKAHEISVSSADLRRDIAEQTGEETGLIELPGFDGEDGG
jgi:predicted  nucleic acid-binding Zn-ribbon protein